MDKNKKAKHKKKKKIGKLSVCDYELPKKNMVCESVQKIFSLERRGTFQGV